MERYVLEARKDEIESTFGVGSKSEVMFESNYNVMPGHVMPVILKEEGQKNIERMKWGLNEAGSEDAGGELMIEEIKKSSDRWEQLKTNACIIPASGFYKWKETVKDPLPFYLRVISDEVTAFAGLYTSFKDENGREMKSFVVLTMPANALVEPLDDRMPVILRGSDIESWLSGDAEKILEKGISADDLLPDMTVFRVPELVNDPSNNSKELIQPIPKLRNYDGVDGEE